jgi:hypothetical protein
MKILLIAKAIVNRKIRQNERARCPLGHHQT